MRAQIGMTLYGYCNGFLGDNYNDKRIEYIGYDYIVVRDKLKHVALLQGKEFVENIPENWLRDELDDEY